MYGACASLVCVLHKVNIGRATVVERQILRLDLTQTSPTMHTVNNKVMTDGDSYAVHGCAHLSSALLKPKSGNVAVHNAQIHQRFIF